MDVTPSQRMGGVSPTRNVDKTVQAVRGELQENRPTTGSKGEVFVNPQGQIIQAKLNFDSNA